ncbi:TonB family protein [Pseudoalteromonas neustonica]|uniref:TonB family protein n=2 Tax=Pseudoalteromonas TaxID=53246 RepID=A0ABU9U754_9GAMM|nr:MULTISPECIES: TonB family protein [Pseudoalteromonas]
MLRQALPIKKIIYFIAGCISVALAVIGMLLPVMPTTVFLIIALACFTRSNKKLANWLLTHPKFGNVLSNWQVSRVVPKKAKYFALISILISFFIITLTSQSVWLPVFCFLIFALVINYLFSKPSELYELRQNKKYKILQGVLLAVLFHFIFAWIIFFNTSTNIEPVQHKQTPKVIDITFVEAAAPKPELVESKKVAKQATQAQEAVKKKLPPPKAKEQLQVLAKKQPDKQDVIIEPVVKPPTKEHVTKTKLDSDPKNTKFEEISQDSAVAAMVEQQYSLSQQQVATGKKSWRASLLGHLMAYRKYPTSAIMKKQEGVVYLKVLLARDGGLMQLDIVKGSGINRLDIAAIETIRGAEPFPKVPDELEAPHELLLPVEFYLRNK